MVVQSRQLLRNLDQRSLAQLLQSLKQNFQHPTVNATETLPLQIGSKNEVYASVADKSNLKGFRLKTLQSFAYAKQLLRFYRHGLSVVWSNNKAARQLRKNSYNMTGFLNSSGKNEKIAVPNFQVLTKTMAQHIYMNKVENSTYRDATTGDVVRTDMPVKEVDEKLFNMTRAEYQLLKRTPLDFVKLPTFAILVGIFMETTPILCYVFPEVTPLTCVLPSIVPRLCRPQAMQEVSKIAEGIANKSDYVVKTAYNLPEADVRALADLLRLKTKYIPSALYPMSLLRDRLQDYFNYLTVDNYYLSGQSGEGNLRNLNNQELILACLERNLVSDTKELVRVQSHGTLEERTKELDNLRYKLAQFLLDFQNCNVGYLTVACWAPLTEQAREVTLA